MGRLKYGLIGEKLSHSYSAIIHNMLGYEYELCELSPDMLDIFIKKADFLGINVTIPYKKKVLPYLSEISHSAMKIGSVNTIIKKTSGTLLGYNTDYDGFKYLLRRSGIELKNQKVLILGTGGTALTAKAVSFDSNAKNIVLISRNGKNNYSNIEKHNDADIIINTTPVGMYPNNGISPIELTSFASLKGVVDVIYNPLITQLLFEAQKLGIPYTNGMPMLVSQAVFASKLFFNKELNNDIIEEIIIKMENRCSNIVLIGMPGCGKTQIGNEISRITGREVVDTDRMVEELSGLSNDMIFEKYGEEIFRDYETKVAKIVGKRNGLIISTGGGIIKRAENIRSLKQNGILFFIQRDTSLLARYGRPLSSSDIALRTMYKERLPIYQKCCDKCIQNNSTIQDAANEIVKLFDSKKECFS